jgi:hypothetical protein
VPDTTLCAVDTDPSTVRARICFRLSAHRLFAQSEERRARWPSLCLGIRNIPILLHAGAANNLLQGPKWVVEIVDVTFDSNSIESFVERGNTRQEVVVRVQDRQPPICLTNCDLSVCPQGCGQTDRSCVELFGFVAGWTPFANSIPATLVVRCHLTEWDVSCHEVSDACLEWRCPMFRDTRKDCAGKTDARNQQAGGMPAGRPPSGTGRVAPGASASVQAESRTGTAGLDQNFSHDCTRVVARDCS